MTKLQSTMEQLSYLEFLLILMKKNYTIYSRNLERLGKSEALQQKLPRNSLNFMTSDLLKKLLTDTTERLYIRNQMHVFQLNLAILISRRISKNTTKIHYQQLKETKTITKYCIN